MVRWPTIAAGSTLKAHLSQIERIDKHVDDANGLLSSMKSSRHSGNESPLPTIRLLNEAPHRILPEHHGGSAKAVAFSHSQGHSRAVRTDDHGFRSTPMSGHSQYRRPCFKGARLGEVPDFCDAIALHVRKSPKSRRYLSSAQGQIQRQNQLESGQLPRSPPEVKWIDCTETASNLTQTVAIRL